MSAHLWKPSPIWAGRPCYVVGGGPSLKTFDWDVLRDRAVIGCNVTCYRDPKIIPWTIFGDCTFLTQNKSALEKYAAAGGSVVTISNRFRRPGIAPEWLKLMRKQVTGLGTDRLGWNGNTGAAAINLALLFGANPIYLLGFDMKVNKRGKANYHNAYTRKPNPKAYIRFMKRMPFVVKDLKRLFPDRKVINLEDNTSALEAFPKESRREHFKLVQAGGGHG